MRKITQSESSFEIVDVKFHSSDLNDNILFLSFSVPNVSASFNDWSQQIDNSQVEAHPMRQQPTEVTGNTGAQIEQGEHSVASYVDIETQPMIQTTFETRIKDLVASNRAKVNRIKLLVSENSALLKEVDTLHNINRSMAETIDAFRADGYNDENTAHYEAQITQLGSENDTLRQRIDSTNRAHFDLIAQHEVLKSCVETYTKNVFSEHNYIL